MCFRFALILLTLVGSLYSTSNSSIMLIDYRIISELQLSSKTSDLQLEFQIYRRNIEGKFLMVTHESTSYSFIVEPTKRSICLEKRAQEGIWSFKFFLKWHYSYKFAVTGPALKIDEETKTMSQGACLDLGSIVLNDFPEFGELSVTENEYFEQGQIPHTNLKISGSGCQSGSNFQCQNCLTGFYLQTGTCKKCPPGCKTCQGNVCSECWSRSPQSGACLGTKALVINYHNELQLPYTLNRLNWGVQFFIHYESEGGGQVTANPIIKFKAGAENLELKAQYPGIETGPNEITSIFQLNKGEPKNQHQQVSIGKWLFYSISGDSSKIRFGIEGIQKEIHDSFTQDITAIHIKPELSLLNIYLRQLRIFQNSSVPGDLFYKCLLREKRPSGLSRYFELSLNHQNNNQVDEVIEPRQIVVTSTNGQNTGNLILNNQPIEHQNFQLCEDCFQNCKKCSDILVCSECENGELWGNGICLTSSITPSQGFTDLTRFSAKAIYEEAQDLSLKLQQRQIVNGLELDLPWKFRVNNLDLVSNMVSNYEFMLPTPNSADQNQFTAQIFASIALSQYQRTFNLQLQKPDISNFPEVVQSVEKEQNQENLCGCSHYGSCNENSECECLPGYSGKTCSYTVEDEESLSKILKRIFSQNWFNSLPEEEVLTSIQKLTYAPQLLTSTQRIILLQALEGVNITISNRQRVLNLLSSLADTYGLSSIVDRLVFLIAQTYFQNLTETVTLNSQNIEITVSLYEKSQSYKSAYVYISADSLPQESAYLVQTLFRYKKFKALPSQQSASLTLGFSVYTSDGSTVEVRNLEKGLSINLPLDSSALAIRETLQNIYSEASEVSERMEQNQRETPFLCRFWDSEKSHLSDIGCTFVSVTYEEVTCYCNHMTNFMSFLQTGRDVLVEANHSVFYVLWEMNGTDLKRNIGMYFVFCYWIIYISLAVLFSLVDHCKLKNQFYKKLFSQIHGRQPNYEHESQRKLPTRSETDRSRSRPSQIINNMRASIMKVKPYRAPTQGFGPMKTITLTDITTDAESKNVWSKISKKLKEYASAAKQERKCCCCVLGKVAAQELKTNNLPFNLFTTTSSMSPRLIRLTMFCFACMLEFAVCAFFFEIQSDDEEEDPPFFWQGLIQNFWIALYTVLFTLIPLVLVGCLLSFPRCVHKKFQLACSVEELQTYYKKEQWKLKCSLYLGMSLFVLLSCLFSVYIICFCHIASANSSRDWLSSSLFSIIIDQLVFQIIPAFLVGLLVLANLWCRCCKSTLCLAVIIEVYRLYRNLTDP